MSDSSYPLDPALEVGPAFRLDPPREREPELRLEPGRALQADPPRASSPVPSTGVVALDQVFATMSLDDSTGMQVEREFERLFAGRELTGAGRLVRADRFVLDRHFGRGPGTLAVVALSPPPSTGQRALQVHVALEEEHLGALRALVGREVVFSGRLDTCGPYLRNLYVQAGRVGPSEPSGS